MKLITAKRAAILFFIVASFHLVSLVLKETQWQQISKPMLMPMLALYYYLASKKQAAQIRRLVLGSLLFSLAGDVLLMGLRIFPAKSWLFLAGLGAFLLAHVGYILAFRQLKGNGWSRRKWVTLLFAVYLLGFLWYLWADLDPGLRFPVSLYAVVISTMTLAALQASSAFRFPWSNLLVIGAILFIISDSLIALGSFSLGKDLSIWIMLTYILAQGLIIFSLASERKQSVA